MISVSGYDHSGFEVTLSKVQTDGMSRDEQVSLVGDMLKQLFYMGVNPKGEKTGRGIETQWITHFVLRKKGDKYEADLFNQYLNMKVVTLYLGDDGIEQRFLEKSGLKSLDGLKVYPAGSFDKSEQGEDSEFLIESPKKFKVTIKPNGVYKEGKAKDKQRMKGIL